MNTNRQRNTLPGPPLIVAGNSPTAVAWASSLGEIAPTVLITPKERVEDPYSWAEELVGRGGEPEWRVGDLLPETDYVVGDISRVDKRGVEVAIGEDSRALLHYSALLIVSSPTITWSRSSRFSYEAAIDDLEDGASIVLLGSEPPAASLLIELLSRRSGSVAWMEGPGGPIPSNWNRAARALGAKIISDDSFRYIPFAAWFDDQMARGKGADDGSAYHTIVSVKRETYLVGELDEFGRVQGEERVFFVDAEDLSAPGGPLYTNLMTCVFATGKFPLALKKTKASRTRRNPRIHITKHARKKIWSTGELLSGFLVRSLESRLEETTRLLRQFARQEVTD